MFKPRIGSLKFNNREFKLAKSTRIREIASSQFNRTTLLPEFAPQRREFHNDSEKKTIEKLEMENEELNKTITDLKLHLVRTNVVYICLGALICIIDYI